jgi:NADPH:quinone reductase-like Zn-dependent oxidoreductase
MSDPAGMKANRIHRFGPPDVILFEDVDIPEASEGSVVVQVKASGVGPWDTWIRTGKSTTTSESNLPITLGSDIAGVVTAVGIGVTDFVPGDLVFGVSNPKFNGGNAEYALASSRTIALKPESLSFVEAASVPVVAVTAWQMLEHAMLAEGQAVLVLGAAGNVGAFVAQLARTRGLHVVASGSPAESERLHLLGAKQVIDVREPDSAFVGVSVNAVIDTVGGELQARALGVLKPGGAFVSAVASLDVVAAGRPDVRSVFFLVDVSTACLDALADLFDGGLLKPNVGVVLPLSEAVSAHEMLEGTRPRPAGKIVLRSDT